MKSLSTYVFLLCLLISSAARAEELQISKFNFGLSGSIGVGSGISSGAFIYGNTNYTISEINARFGIRMSPRSELQFVGGGAYYFIDNNTSSIFHNDDHWGWNAEINGLFYFRKHPTQFDPYLLVGSGFPKILHLGIGNRFVLSKSTSAFVEIIPSMFIFDVRIEGRAGVSFHF